MTPEENIKKLIGDQAFAIAMLQGQLSDAYTKIAELEKNKEPDGEVNAD
jgi:hypothetical protein